MVGFSAYLISFVFVFLNPAGEGDGGGGGGGGLIVVMQLCSGSMIISYS